MFASFDIAHAILDFLLDSNELHYSFSPILDAILMALANK